MPPVVLFCRLLLSGIFLLAGSAKLRDRAGSRQSLRDFGVPRALAAPGALLLSAAELLAGICLLPRSFAWIGAILAGGLLAAFVIAIAVSLARGRKPDCHCFGQLHSQPIGWGLAARDALLAGAAALVVSYGPRQPSFLSLAADTQTSGGPVFLLIALIAVALLVFQSFLIYQLIQQGGRVLLRLDELEKRIGAAAQPEPAPPAGLPVGETAPAFELPDLDGQPVSLERLRSGGKPVILLFIHPGCGPCSDLLSEAAAWQRDRAAHFHLVPLSQGGAADNRKFVEGHTLHSLLLQKEHEIFDAYEAQGTPSAVLVRPDGMIGAPLATGAEAIRSLIANTINESLAGLVAIQLQEGATAPPLVFPDLDGRMFNLSQLREGRAILLFWNPGCGYCQQMSDDLKTWEKKAAKSGTQVVLISAGSAEANRKQGFRSPILLDQNFSAGKAFGATGTPSGVLLNAGGIIASKVAVGRQEILDGVFHAAGAAVGSM